MYYAVSSVPIEPASRSVHCDGNVCLPFLHSNPPVLCSRGTILQCHVGAGLGGGRGVSGGTDICS